MINLRKYGILLALLLTAATDISAQWKNVAPNLIKPANRPNLSGGVIIYSNGILWAGAKDIWMSPDTGKTWSLRTPFDIFSNNPCVKDICFYNDQIGLATTQNGEVFITQDQGLSWTAHIPNHPYRFRPSIESAKFIGSPNNIIACTYSGDRYVSLDGGMSWVIILADSIASQVIAGNGGTAYIIGGFDRGASVGSHLYETNDFGTTWFMHPGIFPWDSYSFARDKCDTTVFYVATDDLVAKAENTSSVNVSMISGSSWTAYDVRNKPYHCGSVSAAPNAVFVQTFSGINRSIDQGRSWKEIGGPPNITDTRFVAAINNNIVAAVDSFGSVWITDNGGGDSIRVLDFAPLALVTADQKTDTVGGSVAVPLSITGLTTTEDFTVVIHYDKALVYRGTFSPANTKLDMPGESWAGRSKIVIASANAASIISHSYFDVYAGNSSSLKVSFDSATVLTSIVPCYNILPASIAATSTITTPAGCYENILSRFIRDSTMPQLSIVPNPSNGEVSISSTSDLGEVSISIYDMLGTKRSECIAKLSGNSDTKLALPFSNGVYSVRVKSASRVFDLRIIVNR